MGSEFEKYRITVTNGYGRDIGAFFVEAKDHQDAYSMGYLLLPADFDGSFTCEKE